MQPRPLRGCAQGRARLELPGSGLLLLWSVLNTLNVPNVRFHSLCSILERSSLHKGKQGCCGPAPGAGRSGSTDSHHPDCLAVGALPVKSASVWIFCGGTWCELPHRLAQYELLGLSGTRGAFPAAVVEFGPGTHHSGKLSLCLLLSSFEGSVVLWLGHTGWFLYEHIQCLVPS